MINKDIDYSDAQGLRRKAEEKLKASNMKGTTLLEGDTKKLLHELQVHQIELEMQNEELREAYDAAETALKKYTMLYDFAPVGYYTLNSEGSICELNFTGAEILGEKRHSLINSNFKLFVSEDSLPVFNAFFSRLYNSDSKEWCNLILGYDKKTLCSVYMEGIIAGDDRQCLLSVVDLAGIKR